MPTPEAAPAATPPAATSALGAAVASASVTPPAAETPAPDAAVLAATAAAASPFLDLKQLTLPDGVSADPKLMEGFLPLAKELGFTAAQASKLVEFSAKMSASTAAAQAEAQEAAATKAVEALKADKEIGGTKLAASMKVAGAVLAKFGGDGLKEALETVRLSDGSLLGDSPVMAKLLVRFGSMLTEDQMGVSSPPAPRTPANDASALHRSLYPNSPTLKF